MNSPTRLSLAFAVGLAPLMAQAADELNPIVVTAGHTAQTVNEANASVTVISRDDIEQSAFTTVEDMLRSVPGLAIGNNGGVGQQSSVFLRGSNSDHVLVLVDGMRVGGAFFGTAQFQNLPLSLVDRIEVVRGPRSSLYGAEAIGGVIQIFTRRGGEEEKGMSIMRAGNNGTAELVQHLSGGNEDTRYNLSASLFDTEGQDAYIADNAEPDEDGFTSKSLAASASHDVTERWQVGGNLLRAQGTNEFDDTITPAYTYRDFVQQSGRVYSDYQATSRLNLHVQFGFGRESRDVQDSFPRSLETKRRQLKVRGDYVIGDYQMVSFGAERIDTEIEASATDYTTTERYNNAVFGQWRTMNSPLDLQASVRHDDNEAYGEQTTGSVSAGYRVNRYLKPYVSVGTGFRAPNFNDLYSPFGANPDIQPETSKTAEVGLKGNARRLSWQIAAYRTEFDDLIVLDPTTFVPFNVAEATAEGGELSVRYQLVGWRVEMGAGYVRATNDTTGEQLQRRPKWNGRLAASKDFGRVDVDLELVGRSDAPDNPADLPGHVLTNVGIGFEARENVTLGLDVQNLLDQPAPTASGYAGVPRQVLVSARVDY